MKVLILMHVATEGPGTIGAWLRNHGAEIVTRHLYAGESIQHPLGAYDAVVTLGGPMNVDEHEAYPFLREEITFLQRAMEHRVPVLGICLGAQMIARAAGAAVTRAPVPEIGWSEVRLTDEGLRDPIFRGLRARLPVLQWHGDTFAIPPGHLLLATSEVCRHQALRVGSAVGLQFHLETTREMLEEWFHGSEHEAAILDSWPLLGPEMTRHTELLCANFFDARGGADGAGSSSGRSETRSA